MQRILALACAVSCLAAIGVTAATASTDRSSQQLQHATHVLAFFTNHAWLTAPNRPQCRDVPWTQSCLIARERVRFHTRVVEKLRYGHMVEILNQGLEGTPMAGTGAELEKAGRAYGIHPAFIASIAGTESSFGAAMCGNYNAYGLANCSGIWSVPAFHSWGDSYQFMARFLKDRWPSATSPWSYSGYAACSLCWGNKTAYYMQARFGVSASTRYP